MAWGRGFLLAFPPQAGQNSMQMILREHGMLRLNVEGLKRPVISGLAADGSARWVDVRALAEHPTHACVSSLARL